MLIAGDPALRPLAPTLWQCAGGLIGHGDETRASAEAPPAWRTAEAIGACRRDVEAPP